LPTFAPRSTLHARPLLAAALLVLMATVAGPSETRAHAELVSSVPAANATLTQSPDALVLTFTEAVDPATVSVELLDENQAVVPDVGDATVTGGVTVRVELPELDPGVYTVNYQVVSTVDGHATAGIFAFLVDPTGTEVAPTEGPSSTSPSVDPTTIAARWLGLLGSLLALGSLLLWWTAGRHGLSDVGVADRRPPWIAVATAASAAGAGTALYLWLAARPILEAAERSGVQPPSSGIPLDVAGPFGWTPFAIAMRVALVAVLITAGLAVLAAVRGGGRGPAIAATSLLLVALAATSQAAHAAAAGGPLFGALDWLHLVGVAAWLGGLPAAFILASRARPFRPALARILRRHGAVAIVAGPMVILTGVANSPLVLGAPRDLVGSDYGNLLVAKAVLVSVALGLGAVNHLALRGRGRATTATLVGVELVVAALAVAAAATMVTIQPAATRAPRLVSAPVNAAHLYGTVGPSTVHAAVNLPAPGNQQYEVAIEDATSGAPRLDVQKVFLDFTPPAGTGLPGERVEMAPSSTVPGLYTARGAYTPLDGEWRLEVVVRRHGALDESIGFALPVSSPGPTEQAPPDDTGVGVPAPLAVLWPVLPPGPLAWLLVPAALLGAWFVGRRRGGAPVAALRAALVVLALAAGLGAGSRDLVAAANAPPGSAVANPSATPPVDATAVARGERLYQANCAACHGRDGEGDGPVETLPGGGDLAAAVRGASAAELDYRIGNGVAGTAMPAFIGQLTPAERQALVAYLRSRWGGS
jgi:copper transport protein